MPMSLGTTALVKAALGAVEIAKISLGTVLVWQSENYLPAGMDKSGNQAIGAGGPTKITGFTPRSGFGSAQIINDGLQFEGPFVGTVTYKAVITANTGTRTAHLYLNGSQVGSVAAGTEDTYSINVGSGTHRLELYGSAQFAAASTVNAGSTNTYVYTS